MQPSPAKSNSLPGPLPSNSGERICHSDLQFVEGKYYIPTPAVLGHEAAGTVKAVGEQVTYLRPGDTAVTCLSVFWKLRSNLQEFATGWFSKR